ncbi:MAG: hypothetical protein CME71_06945 [Halobacteriovorax sp.]|nr:hypothetical protein [Halobacteriovorax sp.]
MAKDLKLPRRIVLVESDSTLKSLLSQNLELYTGSEVIFKNDADDLVDYLKRDIELPNLIISENMAGDEYTMLKIFYYVNSQKLGIPMILLGENAKLAGQVEQIDRTEWQSVIKTAGKLMEVSAASMVDLDMPEYYPFNLIVLFGLENYPVDFYHDEEGERVLLGSRGDALDNAKLQSLLTAGEETIYTKSLDRLAFATGISGHLQTLLLTEKDPKKLATIAGEAFDSVALMLSKNGISEKSINLARATITAMEKVVKNSPKLDVLMEILARDQNSIAWKHCLMTCVVSSAMIEKVDWGNKDQVTKLAFTSFFHDICIPEDRLSRIQSAAELEEAGLDKEERQRVERHALKACEILRDHPGVPFGVENVIQQHHGMPGGVGFPEDHLDNRITPLAIVFRIAEHYVHALLDCEEEPNTLEIMRVMLNRYNKGHYQKAMEALKACHGKFSA